MWLHYSSDAKMWHMTCGSLTCVGPEEYHLCTWSQCTKAHSWIFILRNELLLDMINSWTCWMHWIMMKAHFRNISCVGPEGYHSCTHSHCTKAHFRMFMCQNGSVLDYISSRTCRMHWITMKSHFRNVLGIHKSEFNIDTPHLSDKIDNLYGTCIYKLNSVFVSLGYRFDARDVFPNASIIPLQTCTNTHARIQFWHLCSADSEYSISCPLRSNQ